MSAENPAHRRSRALLAAEMGRLLKEGAEREAAEDLAEFGEEVTSAAAASRPFPDAVISSGVPGEVVKKPVISALAHGSIVSGIDQGFFDAPVGVTVLNDVQQSPVVAPVLAPAPVPARRVVTVEEALSEENKSKGVAFRGGARAVVFGKDRSSAGAGHGRK